MNPRVKSVTALNGFKLSIQFTNNEMGIYDVQPFLNFGVFSELKEESYFKRVKVFNGTVVWPNEQDICPDTVYLESIKTV